ncbi:toprim domain-containing protein [Pseudomonas sp. OV226]|uniref:toprim domain-containing protein n=1 Tax=Pseudomonas sp. OV226 TaxID=2135588 RepID=UPI000D6B9FE8|nr:toprim domain-containing protein [Pseudomonas sp. OV226]PWK32566.1 putative DNA primase/helicase [Pseudomonas sp. OV226]
MSCPEFEFLDDMQDRFGQFDFVPIGDGGLHRFHVPGDKPGSKNGWYVLHLDGIASGAYGSWKAGVSGTWCSRKPVDALEAALVSQRIEQARLQREAERVQRQQHTAQYANRLWNYARRADPEHSYLVAKWCRPYSLRQQGHALLVPLYWEGQLVNLQRIGSDGQKRFLPGGRITGCYSPIGLIATSKPLYLCEGWATGATIHADSGCPVACAMNAGNLLAAGEALKARYPDVELIVAGDDDRQTEAEGKGNPGREEASAAALALSSDVVFPQFPKDAPLDLSDFNDLRQWMDTHHDHA